MSDVTRMLDSVRQGEAKAAEELLPLVCVEVRRLAAQKIASEPPGQTLESLGLGERTATRTWAYARAWLYEELNRTP